jgi:hypothetical protein
VTPRGVPCQQRGRSSSSRSAVSRSAVIDAPFFLL